MIICVTYYRKYVIYKSIKFQHAMYPRGAGSAEWNRGKPRTLNYWAAWGSVAQ